MSNDPNRAQRNGYEYANASPQATTRVIVLVSFFLLVLVCGTMPPKVSCLGSLPKGYRTQKHKMAQDITEGAVSLKMFVKCHGFEPSHILEEQMHASKPSIIELQAEKQYHKI